jgi:hypothetical protein
MWRKIAVAVPLLCFVSFSAIAQTDCPAIVQTALEAADSACQGVGRNQACYGNVLVNATSQPDVEDFSFDQSGDIVDVVNIQSLQLEPLSEAAGTWGVAVMKLQASLPDTLPGQNVTFLLFGNVEIENAVAPAPQPVLLDVTANSNANVRGEPSTNGAIVGSLAGGDVVNADGRNEAGDWLHIQFEEQTGWVFAELVTLDGDVNSLLVVEADFAAPSLKPMQSFYFRSGVGDAPCAEAPDSGILIQTPAGAGEVALTVNGVDVLLGSTAYLQAQPGDDTTVNLLEGGARVSAQGQTKLVPAGTRVTVPVDQNLEASGPPSDPEPYDESSFAALPIANLEREIEIAPALTQEEIEALTSLNPVSGDWLYETGAATVSGSCPPGMSGALFPTVSQVVTLNFSEEFGFETLWEAAGQAFPGGVTLENPEPGLYTMDYSEQGSDIHWEVQFLSPTQAEGFVEVNVEGCIIMWPHTMTAQ